MKTRSKPIKARSKTASVERPYFTVRGVKHYIGAPLAGKGTIPIEKVREMMRALVASRDKPIVRG